MELIVKYTLKMNKLCFLIKKKLFMIFLVVEITSLLCPQSPPQFDFQKT